MNRELQSTNGFPWNGQLDSTGISNVSNTVLEGKPILFDWSESWVCMDRSASEQIYRMTVTTWSGSDAIGTGLDSGKAAAIVKERRATREPDTNAVHTNYRSNSLLRLCIFRVNVQYASLHQYPYYPGTGAASETGVGRGAGATVNCPMAAGAGDEQYRRAFMERILPAADGFAPEFVILSAGFDAHAADPLAQIRLTTECFGWMPPDPATGPSTPHPHRYRPRTRSARRRRHDAPRPRGSARTPRRPPRARATSPPHRAADASPAHPTQPGFCPRLRAPPRRRSAPRARPTSPRARARPPRAASSPRLRLATRAWPKPRGLGRREPSFVLHGLRCNLARRFRRSPLPAAQMRGERQGSRAPDRVPNIGEN